MLKSKLWKAVENCDESKVRDILDANRGLVDAENKHGDTVLLDPACG